MDFEEAQKIAQGFEEAYVAAHANEDVEVLLQGFHPDVEVFLNATSRYRISISTSRSTSRCFRLCATSL